MPFDDAILVPPRRRRLCSIRNCDNSISPAYQNLQNIRVAITCTIRTIQIRVPRFVADRTSSRSSATLVRRVLSFVEEHETRTSSYLPPRNPLRSLPPSSDTSRTALNTVTRDSLGSIRMIIWHSRSNISSSLQSEWLAILPADHHRFLFWRFNFIVHCFLHLILLPRNCQIRMPILSCLCIPSGIVRWQILMVTLTLRIHNNTSPN